MFRVPEKRGSSSSETSAGHTQAKMMKFMGGKGKGDAGRVTNTRAMDMVPIGRS